MQTKLLTASYRDNSGSDPEDLKDTLVKKRYADDALEIGRSIQERLKAVPQPVLTSYEGRCLLSKLHTSLAKAYGYKEEWLAGLEHAEIALAQGIEAERINILRIKSDFQKEAGQLRESLETHLLGMEEHFKELDAPRWYCINLEMAHNTLEAYRKETGAVTITLDGKEESVWELEKQWGTKAFRLSETPREQAKWCCRCAEAEVELQNFEGAEEWLRTAKKRDWEAAREYWPKNADRLPKRVPMPAAPRAGKTAGELKPAEAKVTFADVGGMDETKELIRKKIIYPLTRPDLYRTYKRSSANLIMLFGPPGCGKSFIARAAAGEAGVNVVEAGIADILDMWLGESEKALSTVFEKARESEPCILIFDELDALGSTRGDAVRSWERQLLGQFLAEVDKLKASGATVLVAGTTNEPWKVDLALRRSGRFEPIYVPPPDFGARKQIFKLHLKGRKVEGDIDYGELARLTDRVVAADIVSICENAADAALGDAMADNVHGITMDDLRRAANEMKSTTLKVWLDTAHMSEFGRYLKKDGETGTGEPPGYA